MNTESLVVPAPQKTLQRRVDGCDWEAPAADTQYLTHSIHRYSGKFIPQIARQAIELLSEPGDTVLDPYCGSGTTVLECLLTGRQCVGVDINPLAIMIASAKTTPVPQDLMNLMIADLERNLGSLVGGQLSLLDPGPSLADIKSHVTADSRWCDPWYTKWFAEEARLELIAIHQQISAVRDIACRRVALVAFSDILRRASNAHSSYPNVMFDRNHTQTARVTPMFLDRLHKVSQSVLELGTRVTSNAATRVVRANARKLPVHSGSVKAVITHPPYIGSIPYAEYGLLSLVWLGHNPKELDLALTGGRRQSRDVVTRFSDGFAEMLSDSYRVLTLGGHLFMLLGNPMVRGERIDLTEMATSLARDAGFSPAAIAHRSGINRRANKMGQETLLFFRKD